MSRSRWICLVVIALYVAVVLMYPLSAGEPVTGLENRESSILRFVDAFLVFLGFVCIW